MLQAALNGDRDHPATPRTAPELAADAGAAGARSLRLHPYAGDRQTLAAGPRAAALRRGPSCPTSPA